MRAEELMPSARDSSAGVLSRLGEATERRRAAVLAESRSHTGRPDYFATFITVVVVIQ